MEPTAPAVQTYRELSPFGEISAGNEDALSIDYSHPPPSYEEAVQGEYDQIAPSAEGVEKYVN